MPKGPDSLIEIITRRLRAGQRVRRRLGEHGWLHIDRPVPFLCVHRLPENRPDKGTRRLVMGEGSFLLADGSAEAAAGLERLMHGVVRALSDEFKAVLLIEVSSNPDAAEAIVGRALVARPCFRVVISNDDAGRATVAVFVRALRRIRILGRKPRVKIVRRSSAAPPRLPPLLDEAAAKQWSVLSLGLEVPPIHQDPVTGEVFPGMLRQMHRHVSRALKQVCFRFAHLETPHRPAHYLTLGQRALLRSVREADEQLAAVDDSFNLLLAVTPVNTRDALAEFAAGGYRRAPTFHYRLLEFDPDVLKRRLYGISLELIEDPALGELLRDKREELDRQITLLHDRNTERFLYGSLQLYGGVDDELAALAETILARPHGAVSAADRANDSRVGAAAFALRAAEEIGRYRQVWPELSAGVEVRDDVPGLLVTCGRLLISEDLGVPADRVEPLIQHEIGTHVLTYHNALAQPLKLLAAGLPGYDELQEGTAVLAEYLVGGLQLWRLRRLAARVLAVRRLEERRRFAEVFAELHEGHGFGRGTSFTTTMRVFRGGGFTKDAVYLRGLARLLVYLADGGEVEPLFLGKVSHASLPIVRELRWREVLGPAPLRPRFLDLPGAQERLERLRGGATVTDLAQER